MPNFRHEFDQFLRCAVDSVYDSHFDFEWLAELVDDLFFEEHALIRGRLADRFE
jgi:hypothetical protein